MSDDSVLIESAGKVLPTWIDNNGHMHDACYVEAFNVGLGKFLDDLGLGKRAIAAGHSVFNQAMNIDYLRELLAGEELRITLQLLDWDHTRLHVFLRLYQAQTGALCATNERLIAHIDLVQRRSSPFPAEILKRIEAIGRHHAELERPERVGRKLGIRRRAES